MSHIVPIRMPSHSNCHFSFARASRDIQRDRAATGRKYRDGLKIEASNYTTSRRCTLYLTDMLAAPAANCGTAAQSNLMACQNTAARGCGSNREARLHLVNAANRDDHALAGRPRRAKPCIKESYRPTMNRLFALPAAPGSGLVTASWPRCRAALNWWARQDSNLRPNRYERSALTN